VDYECSQWRRLFKPNQFIKENIKEVLSDNKILMSTAFAALLQTLKADPQMVNLIIYPV
jgi:hypothetical protein